MIRAALLSGITWTIACAPAQGSYQFLSPEPAEVVVEVQSVWGPVDALAPEPTFVAATPQTADDPVRDVVFTDPPYNVKVEPRSNNAIAVEGTVATGTPNPW